MSISVSDVKPFLATTCMNDRKRYLKKVKAVPFTRASLARLRSIINSTDKAPRYWAFNLCKSLPAATLTSLLHHFRHSSWANVDKVLVALVENRKCALCGSPNADFNACWHCKQTNKEAWHALHRGAAVTTAEQTSMERYGVSNPAMTEHVKAKIEQRFIENYGATNPNKVASVRRKIRDTCQRNHGGPAPASNPAIRSRMQSTCYANHGVSNPMHSLQIKEKVAESNLEKFGFMSPLSVPAVRAKGERTNLKRYGVPNGGASEVARVKRIQTNQTRRGVDYPAQDPAVLKKVLSSRYKITELVVKGTTL